MFGSLTNYGDSLFDDFRRVQDEMNELFGRSPADQRGFDP